MSHPFVRKTSSLQASLSENFVFKERKTCIQLPTNITRKVILASNGNEVCLTFPHPGYLQGLNVDSN
jgi:hypothetical protein